MAGSDWLFGTVSTTALVPRVGPHSLLTLRQAGSLECGQLTAVLRLGGPPWVGTGFL